MTRHGRRLAQLAISAFGVLAMVAAAGMLSAGGSGHSTVPNALAVFAFGASLTLVGWAQLTQGRSRSPAPLVPDRNGVVTVAYDRRYEVALSLASLLLALAGGAMAVGASGGDDPGLVRVIGVVAAVFFGAIALIRARSLRRPRRVRLHPDRLEWEGPLAGHVRWEDVAAVARYETFGNPLLGIALHEGATIRGTNSPLASFLPSLGRGMTGFDASIALDGLPCDADALERLVQGYVIRAGGSATFSP